MSRKLKRFLRSKEIRAQLKSNDSVRMSTSIDKNLAFIRDELRNRQDLRIRKFFFGNSGKGALLFLDGMIDESVLNEYVLKPLMTLKEETDSTSTEDIYNSVISVATINKESELSSTISALYEGKSLILFNGEATAIIVDARSSKGRQISEPTVEGSLRGSHEGFIESLQTNLALIKKIIKNKNLHIESIQIGEKSKTAVSIIYMYGVADHTKVEVIRNKLSQIKVDAVLDSGFIEQWLENRPLSLFPTVYRTEKPDIAAAKLFEGKIAIMVDGSPGVLLVPVLLKEFFETADDYYARPLFSSLNRILRYLGTVTSCVLPALYIAVANFSDELIPTNLLVTFTGEREGRPFPLSIEMLLIIILFEWIRESGIRMPRNIGQALSIVGTLVIGEAAVSAGLIGASTVIIIAAAGITSFITPALLELVSILRLLFLIGTSIFGLYGLFIMLIALFITLGDTHSFGSHYMKPIMPIRRRGWKDFLVRFPFVSLLKKSRI
ncbi:spore germination protein [Paenibacillus oralis]|uniref:Spore germination protein n=1 Tax=Paenibacillus oralis TaxID=2490856 RepID=A0A3P3UFQ6_9BACL|nr:spore germination protein [Paenibacillus oralis]RRJ67273.1 spore germination protein [Paenibacillus oralis]